MTYVDDGGVIWHRLSCEYRTKTVWPAGSAKKVTHEVIMIMAAACFDGIGVIVTWERSNDGWTCWETNNERDGGPVTEFHEGLGFAVIPPAGLLVLP